MNLIRINSERFFLCKKVFLIEKSTIQLDYVKNNQVRFYM